MSQQVKAQVRLRDGMRCIDCDLTNERHVERYGRQLDVHRITPGSPYSLEGCVTVCRPCHKKRHPNSSLGLPRHTKPKKVFHDEPALFAALAAFRESLEVQPDESEIIRVALRDYLTRKGFWPWPKP